MVDGGIQKSRTRHRTITKGMAHIMLNVKNFFKKEKEKDSRINVKRVNERVAQATGIGKTTISSISSIEDVQKFASMDPEKRTRNMMISDEFVSIMRKAIHELLIVKKTIPTLDNILEIITSNSSNDVRKWKHRRTTKHKFMQHTGFRFDPRNSHYDYTKERQYIFVMRESYLLWIEKYRSEGWEVYYQDETWANKNMGCNKVWQFTGVSETLYKVLSGKRN